MNYRSDGRALFNKDKTLLLRYFDSEPVERYVLPETVKEIGAGAFEANGTLV